MITQNDISTPLIKAFTFAWAAIQKRHPDVPNVVMTLGAGHTHKGTVLGHFAPRRWSAGEATIHELFVGGEGLQRTPAEVMATLLHEAAHGVAVERGIQDVSRGGRYHNAKFKALGEELGIELALDPAKNGIGWSLTTMPEATAKRYAAAIGRLEGAMVAYRRGVVPAQDGEPGKPGAAGGEGTSLPKGRGRSSMGNGVALTCTCSPARKIRVSRSTAELGGIRCQICGSNFE